MIDIGSKEYLHFTLNVYYAFFDCPVEVQREKIIHEIVHTNHAALIMFVRDRLINPIRDRNPELHEYLDPEFTEKVESFTQSMAFAIERMIVAAKSTTSTRHFIDRFQEIT